MAQLCDTLNWFSVARRESESGGLSVYGDFVVPLDIHKNDLATIDQSIVLIGGRGTGKTVYLRYFSHWTQFDAKRTDVNESDLKSIILYWKPDTAFCRAIKPAWVGDASATRYFLTLAGLEILEELVSAIENISNHFNDISSSVFKNQQFWNCVSVILNEKIDCIEDAKIRIGGIKYQVENNIYSPSNETSFSTNPKSVLNLVIPIIQSSHPFLSKTRFKIFVDEFENLRDDQQRLINDYRKHSDASISWNVAHKAHAKVTAETSGDENLQEGDDYTTLSIYSQDEQEEFKLLAAEIILSIFARKGGLKLKNINLDILFDRSRIEERRDKEYKYNVFQIISKIFPTPTISELCENALKSNVVNKKIKDKFSSYKVASSTLIDKLIHDCPDSVIAHWLILDQKSFDKGKFDNYIADECPSSGAYADKIKTYSYAALLALNMTDSYVNIPVYSGFDRFFQLSSGSIRHLILIVYHTIKSKLPDDGGIEFSYIEDIPPFSLDNMQSGAEDTSRKLLSEIQNFTPQGKALSSLTRRLGDIFSLSYRKPGQSEPEISHFFIKSDYGVLSNELQDLISNARSWRILIAHKSTKDKDSSGSALYEYQLNPMYAPAFGISYRKIRRLELSLADFITICTGDADQYQSLRNRYVNKFIGKEASGQRGLFND